MNIVLIGMPGSGKSTIGVLLAKSLLMDFIDTDLLIQKNTGKSLSELISAHGVDGFNDIENRMLSAVSCEHSVIATGGSAVYGTSAMENLKRNAVTVYLKLEPSEIEKRIKNIKTRGISMKPGTTIADLYNERAPLYEMYADIVFDCSGKDIERCVSELHRAVEKYI